MNRRMILGVPAVSAALALSFSIDISAYEQTTHAAMTREALMQSQLSPAAPDLLKRLGISDRQVSLGNTYLDVTDLGVVVSRSNAPTAPQYPADFGRAKIRDANRLAVFR